MAYMGRATGQGMVFALLVLKKVDSNIMSTGLA